jgi:hypothetical protein
VRARGKCGSTKCESARVREYEAAVRDGVVRQAAFLGG